MKKIENKISCWKKYAALMVVFSLILTLIEPLSASKRELIIPKNESNFTLRKVSQLIEGGKFAPELKETPIHNITQSLTQTFALSVGIKTIDIVRAISVKSLVETISRIQLKILKFLIQRGWINPWRLTPHISALHPADVTLVDLVTMIYEKLRDEPELREKMGENYWNEMFRKVIIAVEYGGKEPTKPPEDIAWLYEIISEGELSPIKNEWDERDIEREGRGTGRVLTEFLRYYLRDYTEKFVIPREKLALTARELVLPMVQEKVKMAIHEVEGPFRFLGIKKVDLKVVDDKHLIDKFKHRGFLAFYREDQHWRSWRDYDDDRNRINGNKHLSFPPQGELVIGTSLLHRWVQLTEEDREEEIDAEIYDLVMREFMARTLNEYVEDSLGSTSVWDAIYEKGHNLGFDGQHDLINKFPATESLIKRIISNFGVYISNESHKFSGTHSSETIIEDRFQMHGLGKHTEIIEQVIKNFPNQERLLRVAGEIVGKTIVPLIVFGITLGSILSGSALAYHGSHIQQSINNWDPLLLGGIIGSAILSFFGNNPTIKKSISSKKNEIKTSLYKIINILKEPFESLYDSLKILTTKEPRVRILINWHDPNSIAEAKTLISKIESEKSEPTAEGIKDKVQLIVAGDFKALGQSSDIDHLAAALGIPAQYIKKTINQTGVGDKIDLDAVLNDLKTDQELSKEDYSLWIINSRYWNISKLIESIASKLFLKSGTQILNLQMIGYKLVGAAA